MPENISQGGLSTEQAFEVGAMTKGNISNKKSSYCIYYQDRLKNYQRETKLSQFSRDWLRVEDKKKRRHFAKIWLNWLRTNGFVCDGFYFSRLPIFTNIAIIFLDDELCRKILARRLGFLDNENAPWAYELFHNDYRAINVLYIIFFAYILHIILLNRVDIMH